MARTRPPRGHSNPPSAPPPTRKTRSAHRTALESHEGAGSGAEDVSSQASEKHLSARRDYQYTKSPQPSTSAEELAKTYGPAPRRSAPMQPLSRSVSIVSAQGPHATSDIEHHGSQSEAANNPDQDDTDEEQQQVDEKTIDVRTHFLSHLREASDKLFEEVITGRHPDTVVWEKGLSITRHHLEMIRSEYSEDESFIELKPVAETVREHVRQEAQGVMALANLAQLVDMLSSSPDTWERLVQRLDDSDFPLPFIPWLSEDPSESDWSLTTKEFTQGVDIRTQHMLMSFDRQPKNAKTRKTAEQSIRSFFCREQGNGRSKLEKLLTEENMDRICGLDWPLPEEPAKLALQRAHEIYQITAAKPFDMPRDSWPLGNWQEGLLVWACEKYDEIRLALDPIPGEEISKSTPPDAASQNESEPSQNIIRPPKPTPVHRPTKEKVAYVHREQPVPHSPAQKNDPSSSSSAGREVTGQKRPRDQSPPLGYGDAEEQDDAFEQDNREPDARRRAELDRENMPPPMKRPCIALPASSAPQSSAGEKLLALAEERKRRAQPRQRRAQGEDDPFNEEPQPRALVSPSLGVNGRSNGNDSDHDNHDDHDETRSNVDYAAIAERNRQRAISNKRAGGSRRRVPWNNGDIKKLIRYIKECECKWSEIVKLAHVTGEKGAEYDPSKHFEVSRDQQAIRDKARNLKVDFMKADMLLPPCFDYVYLGVKEIKALKARGKNPYRDENDVDLRTGRPTNTEWEWDEGDD